MSQITINAGMGVENATRFKPTVTEVMAAIFAEYKFSFGGEEMLPQEVFGNTGFMPVISHLACIRINDLFGVPFAVDQAEDENAILGVAINPGFNSTSAMMLYLLSSMIVSEEIFGMMPGLIDLDELYQWSTDVDMQQKGLPYLGVKH